MSRRPTRERTLLTLDLPGTEWPGPLLNANSLRGQTRHLGRLTAPWRALAARSVRLTGRVIVAPPVRVWVEVTFPNNRRRDSGNLAPTAKALVDAGVIPDDCDGLLEGPFVRRVYPNGSPRLRVIVEQIPLAHLGRPHGGRAS